jgi:hypothetical protein
MGASPSGSVGGFGTVKPGRVCTSVGEAGLLAFGVARPVPAERVVVAADATREGPNSS